MSSVNNSGGEDGGDICNIFDFVFSTTTMAAAPEDVTTAAATMETTTSKDDHDGIGGPSYNVVMTTTTTAAAPEETGGGKDGVVGGRRGSRITKALMSDDDLFEYFKLRLGGDTVCPNEGCLCLSMMRNPGACAAVAKYLVRFERLSKHAQDSIIFEWVKYATNQIGKSTGKYHCYHAPFDGDVIKDDQEVLEYVRACKLCATGMKFVMGIKKCRFGTIRRAVRCTSIMPAHKGKGKVSNNGIKCDDL